MRASLPAAQNGLSLGFAAFQLSALNDAEPALVASFNVPIDLVIKPSASDLALGLGNVGPSAPGFLERQQLGGRAVLDRHRHRQRCSCARRRSRACSCH